MKLNYNVSLEDAQIVKNAMHETIMEFLDSKERIAEVDWNKSYKTVGSFTSSFRHIVKKIGIKNVTMTSRKGRIFLIRRDEQC